VLCRPVSSVPYVPNALEVDYIAITGRRHAQVCGSFL
jgi:hypothetical protein